MLEVSPNSQEVVTIDPDFLARQIYDSFYFSQGLPNLQDFMLGVLHKSLSQTGSVFPDKEAIVSRASQMMARWIGSGNHLELLEGEMQSSLDKFITEQASIYTTVLLTGEYANQAYGFVKGMRSIEEKLALKSKLEMTESHLETIAGLYSDGIDSELFLIANAIIKRDRELISGENPKGRPRESLENPQSPRSAKWLSQGVYYGFVAPEEDPYTIKGIVTLAMREFLTACHMGLYSADTLNSVIKAHFTHYPEHIDELPEDVRSLLIAA